MIPLQQQELTKCRTDFGAFALMGMLSVMRIKLNMKRPDNKPSYIFSLFSSVNRLVFETGQRNQWWNIPPRCAKTTLGFIYHAAFAIGLNPRAKFMYITHQRELMREKMNELYQLVNSEFYKQVFPNLTLRGRENMQVLRTKEGGFVRGFSISGHVTGTGAGDTSIDFDSSRLYGGCIILDDLHDASCAYSRTTLISNCQRFEQCITSRRNTADTPFLVIGQRISVYDIFGYLEKTSERVFEKIIIPAILPDGTSIDEERLPVSELQIKERADPDVYWGQYMQTPREPKWRIFKEKDFKVLDFPIQKNNSRNLVAFIDLNSGSMKSLDRSAVAVFEGFFLRNECGYEPKRCGLWLDLWVQKTDPATIQHDIYNFLKKYMHRLHAVVVEEHGIGYKVMADLRSLMPNTVIRGSRRTRSKMDVFQSCSQFVEQGHIYIEAGNIEFHHLFFDEFEKMHTETEYADDIADVLSEFIMWFPEQNKVGLCPPDNLYNKKFLQQSKSEFSRVIGRSPFSICG